MKKLTKFFNSLNSIKFKISKTQKGEKIHQTERNQLKQDIMQVLENELPCVAGRSKTDGIVLEIPNDDLGAVVVTLDIKIKDLNYDVAHEQEQYLLSLESAKTAKDKKKRESEQSFKNMQHKKANES